MNKFLTVFLLLWTTQATKAQTAVFMGAQPMLTYIESFDSIKSWSNNFSSGAGASRFASVLPGGTAAIPDPTRITASTAIWTIGSSAGVQKDTINNRMLLVVSGTTNNTTAVSVDFLMDFTGKNAGTLSFDWENIFNGATTSNRTATLKVYATTNGTNFTDLTAASVTLTNYITANGAVVNVALPSAFDNNPNARLRFYYYNSGGGSTGSRPIIALDNIKITANGAPCSVPANATALQFGAITPTSIQASFTPANPPADEYLVVLTSLGSLTATPADSFIYNLGDIVGDGTVVYRGSGTSFTATNLSPQTNYEFYVFSANIYCNGAARYNSATPLTGTQTTPPGPPCSPPTAQPSNLSFTQTTTSSITVHYTPANDASEYLVVTATSPTLGASPSNGTVYNTYDTLGNGFVVYRGADTNFVTANLNHSTNYYFHVFSLNNYACSNGPAYSSLPPLTGQQSTAPILPCLTPHGAATNLILNPQKTSIHGFFHPFLFPFDGYLVVMSTSNNLTALPQDYSSYAVGNSIGNGTVIATGKNYSFSANNLLQNTTYYFFIFTYNDVCIGGPRYRTATFLSGSAATTDTPSYHFFFGNLHAHSSYSDGNKDNPQFTPADNYAYADSALCMDFLGISEHNHYTQNGNPGMLLHYYQQGQAQAHSYTAIHPDFLALYGMEWGTSNIGGGHALVYGVDSLIGWEIISGSPNYDIFVPKNDFLSDTGLFRKVNAFAGGNAFATLAHPAFSDFQNLANQNYRRRADSAVVAIAVESGPAFSLNTSYSEPGSNMAYLPYYLHMLAKGYRVAPMIDHDNHNTTFGTTASSRTAIIAPSLSKNNFFQAVRNRRMYATQDCDTRAEILIYNNQMGNELTRSFPPAITIYAFDSTNPTAIPSIRLMVGRPRSGALASILHSVNDHVLNFTDFSLQDSTTAYYYADILIDGKRTITAPIWYTRIDTGGTIVSRIPKTPQPFAGNIEVKRNPVGENLELELTVPHKTDVNINIYSAAAQKLLTQKAGQTEGIQHISIPVDALPPGLYLLEATIGSERHVRKFVR